MSSIKRKKTIEDTRFYSPTPPKWRMLGDMFLLLIPVIDGIIAAAPDLEESKKYWLAAGLNLALVGLKFLTNIPKK